MKLLCILSAQSLSTFRGLMLDPSEHQGQKTNGPEVILKENEGSWFQQTAGQMMQGTAANMLCAGNQRLKQEAADCIQEFDNTQWKLLSDSESDFFTRCRAPLVNRKEELEKLVSVEECKTGAITDEIRKLEFVTSSAF
jgi:hypothetical protein